MKGKKSIIRVLTIVMIGAGLLSCMEVTAGELPKAPMVIRAEVGFPGGGMAKYAVNPKNGCIEDFYDKDGKILPLKTTPGWLDKGKETVDFGSFTDSQCRQGVIGIGGSPIEYWGYANGHWFCIGAWDPDCPKWTPRCNKPYTCP
jgi:hypothetical protein